MTSVAPLLHAVDMTSAVKASVARLVAHLGDHRVVVDEGWRRVATGCGLLTDATVPETVAPIVVGPIDVHLGSVSTDWVGFVAPGAVRHKVWQREPTRFSDPTMALWRAGWSPVNVDRIEIASSDATVELVIGVARRTPISGSS